jgi:serine/threonine-protein kinase
VSSPFESGQTVGRYRIVRTLGSGAMGVVYLAEDPQIERLLAIKTVRLALDEPGELADRTERLLREAKTAGRLIHPHIVTLFDAGEHEGTLYLAFEYVEGSDLAERIREGAPLTLAEALRITGEAAAGLSFAHHRGIVHRDVKPANILLTADGRVKISDFGIAKVLGQATELTMTGTVVGSPHYLSPEQVRGEPLDGRSDLFSLGVVLYELLGARRPFDGETITTLLYQILHQEPPPMPLAPGVSARLVEVLSRLLAKDRADRYADGDELSAALAALETDLPTEVLAAPAVVVGGEGAMEATRLLGVTGAQPVAPATRPAERPGEPPATRPAGVPPPPPSALPPPAGSAVGIPSTGAPAPDAPPARSTTKRRRLWLAAAAALALLVIVAGGVAVAGYFWWQGGGSERVAGLLSPEAEPGEEALDAAAPAEGMPAEALEVAEAVPPRPDGRVEPASEEAAVPPPAVPAGGRPVTTGAAASVPAPSPAPQAAVQVPRPPPTAVPQQPAAPMPAAPATADEPEPAGADPDPRLASPRGRRLERAMERRPALRDAVEEALEQTAPDLEIDSGLALVFDVEPPQAFALLDGTVVGRAREHDARSGSPYVLPGPGEYLLKLRSPGMEDYRIRVRASASGPARTTVKARLETAAAAGLAIGDLPLVRVQEAVGFEVHPSTARIELDGRPAGRVDQYPGRFARPATWLRLAPGRHRLSLLAPGYQRRDFAVDVSAGAAEERQRIEARLEPAPGSR